MEDLVPAMRSMSSGFADSRSGDGVCRRHDLLLRATAHCRDHKAA